MSDYLLFVPAALATAQFENCTVIFHDQFWPNVSELQRIAARHSCCYVALTAANNADSVRQMLKMLKDLAPSDRRIVFADDTIPHDLAGVFPRPLCSLLRRVQPCDLLCLSTTAAQQAAEPDTLLTALFRGEVASSAVVACPSLDRFPRTGLGTGDANFWLMPDVLESAVNATLVDAKLSVSERQCLTSGVLLLWDFLDASHAISQTMEGRGTPRTADYWHAIMHRRELDAENAAYWLRRVGSHPAFDRLSANILRWMAETGAPVEEQKLAQQTVFPRGQFAPFSMLELSKQALQKPGLLADRALRRMQYFEILNLLSWSMGTSSSTCEVRISPH